MLIREGVGEGWKPGKGRKTKEGSKRGVGLTRKDLTLV